MTKEIALLCGVQCAQEHKVCLHSSSKQEQYPTADHIVLAEAIFEIQIVQKCLKIKGLSTESFGS